MFVMPVSLTAACDKLVTKLLNACAGYAGQLLYFLRPQNCLNLNRHQWRVWQRRKSRKV